MIDSKSDRDMWFFVITIGKKIYSTGYQGNPFEF